MIQSSTSILHVSYQAVLCVFIACATTAVALANENVAGQPREGATISAADAGGAQAPDRILRPTQLTAKIRSTLGVQNSDEEGLEAFGGRNHPFTTKRASSQNGGTPVGEFPWRATGKLHMKFGASTFVCTASVIRKGLLVTAAHCVHNFGQEDAGFADAVTFEPARHESSRPFGTWTARKWFVPKTYFDGTDVCSATAPGIVCENDVAVVVLEKKNGKSIAEVTGKYDFPRADDDFGYARFLDQRAAQITQLGYPSKDFDGDKMIRTDSLGYWDDPHNVIIGSNQTNGSSGGPWLQNFGIDTSFSGATPPFDNASNQVVATTSWGFVLGTAKVQGASRFSKNTAYTDKSNIESLVESACAANPDAC